VQEIQVNEVVAVLEEDLLLGVSALSDVIRKILRYDSSNARHTTRVISRF
jgi:hypothetical protein